MYILLILLLSTLPLHFFHLHLRPSTNVKFVSISLVPKLLTLQLPVSTTENQLKRCVVNVALEVAIDIAAAQIITTIRSVEVIDQLLLLILTAIVDTSLLVIAPGLAQIPASAIVKENFAVTRDKTTIVPVIDPFLVIVASEITKEL